MGQETPTVLANKIVDILKTDSNPDGLFLHPVTNQRQHLCITGGEPLMTPSIYKLFDLFNHFLSCPTFSVGQILFKQLKLA